MRGRPPIRWVAAFLAVLVAGAVAFVLIDELGPDSEVHAALVDIRRPQKQLLTPESQNLLVTVGGVRICVGESTRPPELDRLDTEEIQNRIIIKASLRTFEDEGDATCEAAFGSVDEVVPLDHALGTRVVIDESRGEHRVISSPAIRAELLRSSLRSLREATQFVRDQFPTGMEPECYRSADRGFSCTYHRGPRRTFLTVFVRPDGSFGAEPG